VSAWALCDAGGPEEGAVGSTPRDPVVGHEGETCIVHCLVDLLSLEAIEEE